MQCWVVHFCKSLVPFIVRVSGGGVANPRIVLYQHRIGNPAIGGCRFCILMKLSEFGVAAIREFIAEWICIV